LRELNKVVKAQIKSGDLVKHKATWHDYGVGLVICKTGEINTWGMRHDAE